MKKSKNAAVCRGCRYLIKKSAYTDLRGTCGYMDITGQSRLKVELENGGYKEDSCVCYERGNAKRGRPRKKVYDERYY